MNSAYQEFSPQVAEQAVHWLIELQGGALDPRQQQAMQQWLQAHEEHRRAWEHIQRVNQRLRGLSSPLAHAALQAPRSASRRRALKTLLILGVGGAVGLTVQQHNPLPTLLADYRSPVGERRRQRLEDGSQLHLNTRSAVDVRFDAQQRLVRLLEGEIQLAVAADARPLNLLTDFGQLQLAEGRYNLRQFPRYSQLSVHQGSASLAGDVLAAGRQARFNGPQWQALQLLDSNAGAWVDGMLLAAHMRLGDFLDELGRYRRGQLNCAPEVAELLISGSYPLADSERILDLLEIALPVRVRRFTRYWVTVEARV
ncbi:FecR domain-containing protein [Pseudomonas auratipiscis]|uniref:FecR domain-containing protein n=1 Tax=Pseudomonas auratipiscis TaxID=3115853 RepID=A0AB35WV97_9PSED|nr:MULTISPECIES: FecR domain-containing protein [unclassified Pseudomonas]MEE1868051.1 FecR domain-containing protein [Pseudomonas sp. 120P]MEE1959078.1 FecR domain-containing protein [Pseudomonas sp. 119P]